MFQTSKIQTHHFFLHLSISNSQNSVFTFNNQILAMKILKLFLLTLLSFTSIVSNSGFIKRQLKEDWKMKITSGPIEAKSFVNKEFNVTVPSNIHLNLQKQKQIPDLFYADNLKALNWLSKCEVSFSTNLLISHQITQSTKIKLIFQGIDTYSDIFFNDKQIGSTNNAFLKYEFFVQNMVKNGNNNLTVKLKSTVPHDADQQRLNRMPFQYAHTRKACYQYSWDWAPYMNTIGIWLPVYMHFYEEVKIDYIWIRNKELTQVKAELDIVLALEEIDQNNPVFKEEMVQINVRLRKENMEEKFVISSRFSRSIITIFKPKLWWPNNIGTPNVYQFEFQLLINGEIVDEKKIVYGLRTVELDEENAKFIIKVNGYPIYCKGANYVPPDMMYPRIINPTFNPKNTYKKLLEDAQNSNFNMLRVWGGGQYEVDEFYELATKKGIMIFQDFMFSDSIYPSTEQFKTNVKQQIIYQIRRLRNHPCLVIWSGNNQILQGIKSWGWSSQQYKKDYEQLFVQLIPNILNIECNYIPYIQSSPSRGVGNGGFSNGGDIHYWGVWAGGSPFQSYQTALGGFNSQFGTQSLPLYKSIIQFTGESDRQYDSGPFAFHERHSSRFTTLRKYMSMYSHKSINFQMQAYASGLVQAYGIQIAIRAQRTAKPVSYGTLYWQMNDAWPAISWSSIDYYGRWKPLQFKAKNLYKDVIMFYNHKKSTLHAINDKLYDIEVFYTVMVMTFEGKILFKQQNKMILQANQNKILKSIPESTIKGKEAKVFVYTQIIYGKTVKDKTVVVTFCEVMKKLQLDQATLNVKYIQSTNQIEFSSSYLIKSLMIDSDLDIQLSDNFIDIVPGIPVRVTVSGVESIKEISSSFSYKSYVQIYDATPLKVNIIV